MIGLVAFVQVRRIERIRITVDLLEREAADDLATLRFIASSPENSRELWVHTPKGTFRFFRVLENSLVEIDRSRVALPDQPPVGFDKRVCSVRRRKLPGTFLQELAEVMPDIHARLVLPGADERNLHYAPVGGAGRLRERSQKRISKPCEKYTR